MTGIEIPLYLLIFLSAITLRGLTMEEPKPAPDPDQELGKAVAKIVKELQKR